MQVFVACGSQIVGDVALVSENSAPIDLQNSRLNIVFNEPLAKLLHQFSRVILMRETGEELVKSICGCQAVTNKKGPAQRPKHGGFKSRDFCEYIYSGFLAFNANIRQYCSV